MRLARPVLLTQFLWASFKASAAPDAATYFREPVLHDAAMWPDGRQVGTLLTNQAGRAMVGVLDGETQAMTPTFSYNNADVIRADWASNARLLLDIANVSALPKLCSVVGHQSFCGGTLAAIPWTMYSDRTITWTKTGLHAGNYTLRRLVDERATLRVALIPRVGDCSPILNRLHPASARGQETKKRQQRGTFPFGQGLGAG